MVHIILALHKIWKNDLNGIIKDAPNILNSSGLGSWHIQKNAQIDLLLQFAKTRSKTEKVNPISKSWLERPVKSDGKVASSPPGAGPEGNLRRPRHRLNQGVMINFITPFFLP